MDWPIAVSNSLWNWAATLTLAAERQARWATVLRLVPFKDGNQWCVLYGENLQVGICGFGNTPEEAIADFEKSMING